MKKVFVLTIIFGFYAHCYTQINYEYLFDFVRPENKIPKEIRLFDYDNDNIDEISFAYSLESMWIFSVYNQDGNQIIYQEEILNEYENLENYCVYSDSINTYLIVGIRGWNEFILRKYDLISFNFLCQYSFPYDELNYQFIAYENIEINGMSIINENNTYYLNMGIEVYSWEGAAGNYQYATEDFLSIFEVSNQIEYLCIIPDCIYVQPVSKIGKGNYIYTYEWSGGGGGSDTSYYSWLKQISYGNNPSANIIWEDDGRLKLLSTNDDTYLDYGIIFYVNNDGIKTYYCLNTELNEILWENSISNLLYPSCNSNLFVNDENHYLICSQSNNIEIRDRINGLILHYEQINLSPKKIMKTQNNQLYFFEYNYNENLGSIYELTNINFVNISDFNLPEIFSSLINYPNPFNPTTMISFAISNDSYIELTIYNIKGQKIKTLTKNEFNKGNYSIIWNGDNENGEPVGSGVYLYKLNVNDKTEAMKKCLLLK